MKGTQIESKLHALETLLCELPPVAVGFSGGVDSTFLAAVCARAVPDRAILVHLDSPFVATPERESFAELANVFSLPVLTIPFDPFAVGDVAANGPERCYHCKLNGFSRIVEEAEHMGFPCVLDGSNADDALADDRPGTRALRELGVRSPLMETGWTKDEERSLLRAWGIRTWSLPAGACLATRIATGEALDARKVDAARACEDFLHGIGCTQVRARIADGEMHVEGTEEDLARITEPAGMTTGPEGSQAAAEGRRHLRTNILRDLERRAGAHGIERVSPIASPYRRGSMNARTGDR